MFREERNQIHFKINGVIPDLTKNRNLKRKNLEVGKVSKLTLGLFRCYQKKLPFITTLLKTSEEIA